MQNVLLLFPEVRRAKYSFLFPLPSSHGNNDVYQVAGTPRVFSTLAGFDTKAVRTNQHSLSKKVWNLLKILYIRFFRPNIDAD